MNVFEQSLVQANRPVLPDSRHLNINDLTTTFKLDKHISDTLKTAETTEKDCFVSNSSQVPPSIDTAIELRQKIGRMSRISESSALQDIIPNPSDSQNQSQNQSEQTTTTNSKQPQQQPQQQQQQQQHSLPSPSPVPVFPNGPLLTNQRRNLLVRKASFDSKTKPDNNTTNSSKKPEDTHQSAQQITTSNINNGINNTNKFNEKSLDPSQVFLHLFQSQHCPTDVRDQPMLIPDDKRISTSIDILNLLPCYLSHKIGVVYVGKHQANDEKAILSNATGSARYTPLIIPKF